MSEWHSIAKIADVPEGEGRAFPYDGRMIAVFQESGEFFAIDDFCPHQGASLAEGFLEDGAVACPWHAWRFSVKNGAWLDNPKVAVDAFDVRIVDGNVEIRERTSGEEPA